MNEPMVYLCDDDEGVRASIAFLLRQHDLQVLSFSSGPDLLSTFDGTPTPPRGVVVLDVRMEPMSGIQVHEALIARGWGERLPVLFLSGHGDIPMAVGAMARGAFHFAEKPYTATALVELIHRALEIEEKWHVRWGRHDELKAMLTSLSPQQLRLMPLVASGELNKTIAWKMELSVRTVEEHRRKIFERLHVHSAAELATLLAQVQSLGIQTT